ncbi:hypothetical protein [Nitrobacter sp. JJSN]|uniref:hypothetical protein n=1 Tax=Nitrobacter sp. JJSN TaxID=3453033 RepID=UPI003F769418
METTTSPAKYCLPITVQMLEVQLHHVRVVEIGRKVMTRVRWMSAHTDDSILNLGRQAFQMFRIPGIVVSNQTAASECAWLIAKQKQANPGHDRRQPLAKCPHTRTHSFIDGGRLCLRDS